IIEHEGLAPAGCDAKLGDALQVLAPDCDGSPEYQSVGTGGHEQSTARAVRPGHDGAIIESDDELHSHAHPAAHPFDDAHDIPTAARERHEIEQANPALLSVEFSLQNQTVAAVPAPYLIHPRGGRQQPAALIRSAEQRGETRA